MIESNENKKPCGHPPNPPDDKDITGRFYDSCYQCFLEEYDRMDKAFEEYAKECRQALEDEE